jgi:hypothetical protein
VLIRTHEVRLRTSNEFSSLLAKSRVGAAVDGYKDKGAGAAGAGEALTSDGRADEGTAADANVAAGEAGDEPTPKRQKQMGEKQAGSPEGPVVATDAPAAVKEAAEKVAVNATSYPSEQDAQIGTRHYDDLRGHTGYLMFCSKLPV